MSRLVTAPADKISGSDFLRHVMGDPNDITGCPQAGDYFLRDGAWVLIREHHYVVPLVEVEGDPLLGRAAA